MVPSEIEHAEIKDSYNCSMQNPKPEKNFLIQISEERTITIQNKIYYLLISLLAVGRVSGESFNKYCLPPYIALLKYSLGSKS